MGVCDGGFTTSGDNVRASAVGELQGHRLIHGLTIIDAGRGSEHLKGTVADHPKRNATPIVFVFGIGVESLFGGRHIDDDMNFWSQNMA